MKFYNSKDRKWNRLDGTSDVSVFSLIMLVWSSVSSDELWQWLIHSFIRSSIHSCAEILTNGGSCPVSLGALWLFQHNRCLCFSILSQCLSLICLLLFFPWVLILQKKTTFKNQWSMIFKARSAPLFDFCLSPPPPPAADMAAVPSPSSPPVQVANQDVMNIFMWPWRTCCFFWWQFQ